MKMYMIGHLTVLKQHKPGLIAARAGKILRLNEKSGFLQKSLFYHVNAVF